MDNISNEILGISSVTIKKKGFRSNDEDINASDDSSKLSNNDHKNESNDRKVTISKGSKIPGHVKLYGKERVVEEYDLTKPLLVGKGPNAPKGMHSRKSRAKPLIRPQDHIAAVRTEYHWSEREDKAFDEQNKKFILDAAKLREFRMGTPPAKKRESLLNTFNSSYLAGFEYMRYADYNHNGNSEINNSNNNNLSNSDDKLENLGTMNQNESEVDLNSLAESIGDSLAAESLNEGGRELDSIVEKYRKNMTRPSTKELGNMVIPSPTMNKGEGSGINVSASLLFKSINRGAPRGLANSKKRVVAVRPQTEENSTELSTYKLEGLEVRVESPMWDPEKKLRDWQASEEVRKSSEKMRVADTNDRSPGGQIVGDSMDPRTRQTIGTPEWKRATHVDPFDGFGEMKIPSLNSRGHYGSVELSTSVGNSSLNIDNNENSNRSNVITSMPATRALEEEHKITLNMMDVYHRRDSKESLGSTGMLSLELGMESNLDVSQYTAPLYQNTNNIEGYNRPMTIAGRMALEMRRLDQTKRELWIRAQSGRRTPYRPNEPLPEDEIMNVLTKELHNVPVYERPMIFDPTSPIRPRSTIEPRIGTQGGVAKGDYEVPGDNVVGETLGAGLEEMSDILDDYENANNGLDKKKIVYKPKIRALDDPGTDWNNLQSRPKNQDVNPMFRQAKGISFEHYPDYSSPECGASEALKPVARRPMEKYGSKIVFVNPSVMEEKLRHGGSMVEKETET